MLNTDKANVLRVGILRDQYYVEHRQGKCSESGYITRSILCCL